MTTPVFFQNMAINRLSLETACSLLELCEFRTHSQKMFPFRQVDKLQGKAKIKSFPMQKSPFFLFFFF